MLSYLLIGMVSGSETTRWSDLAMHRDSESNSGVVVIRFFVEKSAGARREAISQSVDIII